MDCPNESRVIRAALEAVPGVCAVHIDLVRQQLSAHTDTAQASSAFLQKVLADSGFPAQLMDDTETAPAPGTAPAPVAGANWKSLTPVLVSATLLAVGAALEAGLVPDLGATALPARILLGISLLFSMRSFVHRAFSALRHRHADMNTLVTIAALGALALGDWIEAALVALLFAVAHQLEAASASRVRRSIDDCLAHLPATAIRVDPSTGALTAVPVPQVLVDDLLLVHPGEHIPADGIVETGWSEVDQSAMTGESLPVTVSPGATVYAGTANGRGALRVRVTALANQSRASQLEQAIQQAHALRSATERWVDSFARVYTPAVLGLAVVVATLPPLLGYQWQQWFYHALVLLLIACPCALVIATPVAMVSGITALARKGVLVRGGEGIERAARVRAVAFDKTGVLTQGDLELRHITWWSADNCPADGCPDDGGQPLDKLRMLGRVLAVEVLSEHPAARAFVRYAQQALRTSTAQPATADRYLALPGLGGEGMVDGACVWVGSPVLAAQRGAWSSQAQALADTLPVADNSLMTAGSGKQLWLIAALGDSPRPEARKAIQDLERMGLTDIVMLSGDHPSHCEAVAQSIGIPRYHAGLLPQQKLAAVRALESSHGSVAMVGDGLNDAAALAAASFSVAVGSNASHRSVQVADAILWDGNLRRIPLLLAHARRTISTIRLNVIFAIASKVVFAGFALLGFATLWMAVLADVGATLLVTANGLRLLRSAQPIEMETRSEDIAPRTSS
jgi:Cd2+/Zn2+-exporting ATPase